MASSTAQNIINAGVQSAQNSAALYRDVRNNSVKYDDMHIANMRARADVQIGAWKAEKAVREAKLDRKVTLHDANQKVKNAKATAKVEKSKRMAGLVAAAGKGVAGYIHFNKPDKSSTRYLDAHAAYIKKLEGKVNNYEGQGKSAYEIELERQLTEMNGTKPQPLQRPDSGSGSGSGSATSSQLTGVQKEFADAIAGPESGKWGYDAFNQGGAAGGTKVLGKSGSHKEHFGRSLTDMTLGEIFEKQNGPKETHYQNGGLHAVGRYQFIGSTLREEVDKMGLSHDTKFTPEIQDKIFFSHAKRIGNISPWIGPSVNYDEDKRSYLNSLIPQL